MTTTGETLRAELVELVDLHRSGEREQAETRLKELLADARSRRDWKTEQLVKHAMRYCT